MESDTSTGCVGVIVVYTIIGIVSFAAGAWLWTYSVNTALGWAHRPQVFPWWGGGLLGIVPGLGQISPAVAAIVWVANLFVK